MPTPGLRIKRKRGIPNATELRFAAYLDLLVKVGELQSRSAFEPERIRLAKGAYFTPDYTAVDASGCKRVYDVKGAKRTKGGKSVPYVKEAARVRIKVAAALHPGWRFFLAWPAGREQWHEQRIAI